MSAAKRISKKQLKEDKFVETMAEYTEKFREHQRVIISAVVVILVIILGTSWTLNYREALRGEAQAAFTSAVTTLNVALVSGVHEDYETAAAGFEALRSEYQGRQYADWALYFIAFCQERRADYFNAIDSYEQYLAADSDGEFVTSANVGIATCNGGVGRVKPQADMLVELARSDVAVDTQNKAWLYRASQIYLDAGYYEEAQTILLELESDADGMMKRKISEDIKALASRGS
ncbi:MAG: tetratricopeptide repeat protein [bacterium]|nr:tetratricopeptide repeat protein [bacterium]